MSSRSSEALANSAIRVYFTNLKLLADVQLQVRTEGNFLSGLRRESEREQRHGGDECARDDEVEDVEERATTDVHRERHVDVPLRTTVVLLLVPTRRHPCVHRSQIQLEVLSPRSRTTDRVSTPTRTGLRRCRSPRLRHAARLAAPARSR